MLDTNVLISGM